MAFGSVSVWSAGRGSGWIKPESGGNLVYVHKSGIANSEAGRAPRLEKGQRVEYQVGQRPKGAAAINVRPAAAANVSVETEAAVETVDSTAAPESDSAE